MADDINVKSFPIVKAGATGNSHEWFKDYFPNNAGVYVYNDQAGQGVLDGSVEIGGMVNQKTVQVYIPTLDSTSIAIRIEGKTLNADQWAEIYTEVFTVATPMALIWPICEYIGFIRCGILKTGSGTLDRVYVTADIITWRRSVR